MKTEREEGCGSVICDMVTCGRVVWEMVESGRVSGDMMKCGSRERVSYEWVTCDLVGSEGV